MPDRSPARLRARHGTRGLILRVLAGAGSSASLATSEISDKVSKAAGAKIPAISVYSALRTLVKRKDLKVTREGREKVYSIAARRGRPRRAPAPSSLVRSKPKETFSAPVQTVPTAPTQTLPHKLAVGESLVLHVEAVTNVHGQLVVERHPRRMPPS